MKSWLPQSDFFSFVRLLIIFQKNLLTVYLDYFLGHYCIRYTDHYRMSYHCTKISRPMPMDNSSQTSVDLPNFQTQMHQSKTFLLSVWLQIVFFFFFPVSYFLNSILTIYFFEFQRYIALQKYWTMLSIHFFCAEPPRDSRSLHEWKQKWM